MDISTPISRRALLAAGAAGAALAGALPRPTYAASPRVGARAGTTTVTFWDTFVTQAPWMENEIKIFETQHPDIQTRVI